MTGSFLRIIVLILISSGIKFGAISYPTQKADCISCHGDLMKNTYLHAELDKMCDVCHTATGEEHPKSKVKGFTLSEKIPALCFICHTEFQEQFDTIQIVHGSVKDSVSCLNCHNPHSSPVIKLVTDSTNTLCLRCHNKTIKNDSARIRNINQILSRAKSIHPPIEQGGCVNCHNPHFSEKRSLLIGNFPSGQYLKATTDIFELCFMCHDSDLLEAKTTEFGTNFRNGTTNLHFIHVNSDKGRNCTMCHDVHGAVNKKLILDKLQFGSFEMKIIFNTSENGGSCLTACHSVKKYDRTITIDSTTLKK
jgi:predicted CXXCH cytochrome family protein